MRTNKRYRQLLTLRKESKNLALIITGVALAAFGLKGFLIPNHFIDGGITGVSLLMSQITGIQVSVWLILINIPFIFLGVSQIGKRFGLTTFAAIICLALIIYFSTFPVITHDKLLTAIFGGFFLGAGVGVAMRGGCVLDGTEILAVFVNKKSAFSIGDIILMLNILVFACAAFVLSLESALYSVLTYLSATKTIDFIIQGIEEYTGVTIISPKSNEIREVIINNMGRGVTIYKGERGFGKSGQSKNIDIIFTVVTRLETSKLRQEVDRIDRKAFIIMNVITDTRGGVVKRRPLH